MRYAFGSHLIWLGVALIGCSGSSSSVNEESTKAGFMQACATSSDCKDGLLCADSTYIAGLCTKDCASDSECRTSFNLNAFCQTALSVPRCAQSCQSGADCPTSHCYIDTFYDTGLYCIP
jgi:hypothetical protein